jgi:hypothetical protein
MQRIEGQDNLTDGSLPVGRHKKCIGYWLHSQKSQNKI